METVCQTAVTPDNPPERIQDMQVGTQTGARPKEMMQTQDGLNRSEAYPTDLVRNSPRKAEENPASNDESISTKWQLPSGNT